MSSSDITIDHQGALMRIFVTGGSGWIGSAVVPELLAAGHEVVGLARSDDAAAVVRGLGAEVLRGSIDDPAGLHDGAACCEGVVHLAYNHDFSDMAGAAETDRRAIEALGETLVGTDGPLVIASGLAGLSPGRVATELDVPDPSVHPRTVGAELAMAFADRGVRSVSVRFAPTVHGRGDHGFVAILVAIARERGVSGYIEDGSNRWPAVHRLDAARLVQLAVDGAPAGSSVHALAEPGVPTRAIAEAIAAGLDVPAVSVPTDRAEEHFGWLARFFGADIPASNAITRERLGWEPTQPGLLEDLAEGHYFGTEAG
jgi:nucleoside-diphosphate-sugar epimerase